MSFVRKYIYTKAKTKAQKAAKKRLLEDGSAIMSAYNSQSEKASRAQIINVQEKAAQNQGDSTGSSAKQGVSDTGYRDAWLARSATVSGALGLVAGGVTFGLTLGILTGALVASAPMVAGGLVLATGASVLFSVGAIGLTWLARRNIDQTTYNMNMGLGTAGLMSGVGSMASPIGSAVGAAGSLYLQLGSMQTGLVSLGLAVGESLKR